MRIAVFSDSHDNLPNLQKAVGWAERNKVELIIHCGDVCRPGTLEKTLQGFSGDFRVCLGNADQGFAWERKLSLDKAWKEKIFKDYGEEKTGRVKLAFTHLKKRAKQLAEKNKFDFVFYGHTHKPWKEKVKKCWLVNPGNMAGISYRPTFAVLSTETGKLELKLVSKLEQRD